MHTQENKTSNIWFFPYQILVVARPKIWHKAVLSQSPLIDQLNASWITCFHFKINISLIFC